MGASITRKRKRGELDSGVTNLAAPPTKSCVVEDENALSGDISGTTVDKGYTGKSRGQVRQEKSERRSKKCRQETKQDATLNGHVDANKSTHNGHINTDTSSPPLITAFNTTGGPSPSHQGHPKHSSHQKSLASMTTSPQEPTRQHRFIVFIGNLPYTTTTAQLRSHFAKLSPTAIRHSTSKVTGRSRGFAFLEFDRHDRMETCLKLYHHSVFDPNLEVEGTESEGAKGKGEGKREGRRINVELTAGGGGGRSEKRKEKIRGKNRKLERKREKRRTKKREEEADEKGKSAKGGPGASAVGQEEVARTTEADMSEIHPSRRSRVGR